jgi:hypothetical protein
MRNGDEGRRAFRLLADYARIERQRKERFPNGSWLAENRRLFFSDQGDYAWAVDPLENAELRRINCEGQPSFEARRNSRTFLPAAGK